MAKEKKRTEENVEVIESTLTKAEAYIEQNQKNLLLIIGGIALIVAGYFGYTRLYLAPLEKEAHEQMFRAEQYFERDSFAKALNGDNNFLGFTHIADEYSATNAGNLAHYYAGICYYNLKDYDNAIEELKTFDTDDFLVSTVALSAIGDAYVEKGEVDQGLSYYEKAVNKNQNDFTTPIVLMKMGKIYEVQGKYAKALEVYEIIKKDYPQSNEAREIEKYIAQAKIKENK